MNNEFKEISKDFNAEKVVSAQTFNSLLNIHMNYTNTIKSEHQSGGTTAGQVTNNTNVNQYIWQGRKEGFFSVLVFTIIVEIIIRLIFN